MRSSQTLAQPLVVEGIGLHTGAPVHVELLPTSSPCGRILIRDGVDIPALVPFVTDTRRCTTLGREGVTVSTVEHLLAALFLCAIDHVQIHVHGPELPALDGSAQQWFSAITKAGTQSLEGEVEQISVRQPHWLRVGESEFFLMPADELVGYAALDIPDTLVRDRLVGGCLQQPAVVQQIVRARTYGLEVEVQALFEAGLAKGGSLENAVILTKDGYLNDNVWPDEPAWHKVLDLVGDLALCGKDICGQILAVRAGHRSHVALARWLANLTAE